MTSEYTKPILHVYTLSYMYSRVFVYEYAHKKKPKAINLKKKKKLEVYIQHERACECVKCKTDDSKLIFPLS